MVLIRPAKADDLPAIKAILKEVDEYSAAQDWAYFQVADKSGEVVGTVKLDEYKDFYFLSYLALKPAEQNQGIASFLLAQALTRARKDIYLYTIIPEFFRRFGFTQTAPLTTLPKK
ncbi:MAG: GNAT family N-acetyltransferase, partial [Candidatus Margulisbacteria bacterium]|nr:GNAT family N-acetyltransferase [Candidatus Margulisiibacteriota bacterium]